MYKQLLGGIRGAWSVTGFATEEVALYARKLTVQDARQGLLILSMLLLGLFGVEIGLYLHFGLESVHIYTLGLLVILCLHVAISSRALRDTESIYLLGATLLVVSGTAFVLLAHYTATLSMTLFASVTLLFMVIPLVPWGLREGLIVATLIYGTFTLSTWSAPKGFDGTALWALQFIMVSAGLVSLALVTRNASVRKADIRVRFDLEQAHHHMMHLSHKDPLTGAWNRRYLKAAFDKQVTAWQAGNKWCHFALFDLDGFKPINDSYGHDYGDTVLCWVADGFMQAAGQEGFLVRMGGDEFALLFVAGDPLELIEAGLTAARQCAQSAEEFEGFSLDISVGLVSVPPGVAATLSSTYREADTALYDAKARKASYRGALNVVCRALTDESEADYSLTG